MAKVAHLLLTSLRLAWRARSEPTVVLVTAGWELFLLAALLPRERVVAVDWLMPSSRRADHPWPLNRVRAFVVVRRSDIQALGRRFQVAAERCAFVPFPLTSRPPDESLDGGYYYSAGWAHRDWRTLDVALRRVDVKAVVSAPSHIRMGDRVRVLTQLPPDEGRDVMSHARGVVLSLLDTDLPSGPLVLLDALAQGKPVIATDVGGTRDYLTDGINGLLIPPGDPDALAEAIRRLDEDGQLRRELGRAAALSVSEYTESAFWESVFARAMSSVRTRRS